ncbi:MAG: NAD(P)H-dependent oxidoreductase [Chitinispirillales bacterium]|jgi:flavodoxin|nr:NAD(P)H-dependent oxidoreductase [Chitinispirillales bacterium]
MNAGIVIHTSSGHTLAFARTIEEKLKQKGHEVEILYLRAVGRVTPTGKGNFSIKNPPELDEYDTILVGGPVWAFKASPVIMKFFVEEVKTLKGKKALSFVTMGLPFKFTGGDRALRMMNEELEAAGANVLEGEKLLYMFKTDRENMENAAVRICERLGA